MSGIIEITPGERQIYEQTIKFNNFKWFANTPEGFKSKYLEIFPGKKIAFFIKNLQDPKYTHYSLGTNVSGLTAITNNDKFFSLELLADEGVDPPRLTGKVEIILGDTSQSFNIGDPENEKYLKFDATNRNLVLEPGIVGHIKTAVVSNVRHFPGNPQSNTGHNTDLASKLVHVKLSDSAGEEDTLEIKFTLFYRGEITQSHKEKKALPEPKSVKSSGYLLDQNMKIMKDVSSADLRITCGDKKNKKVFNVHKNFLCACSPVFRATIESDMLEGRTNEIYIEEVEEKTLQEMIHYVYTGEFTGADLNVQMVAWLADKYDLPGMMELLCLRMKEIEDMKSEDIADMLIVAGKTHKHFFPIIIF